MKRHASVRFSRGSNAIGRRGGGPRPVARSSPAGDTRATPLLTTTGAPSGSASVDVRRAEGEEVFSPGGSACDSETRLSSPSSSSRAGPPSRPAVSAGGLGLMPPSGHHAGGEGGRFMPPAGHHAGAAGASPSPPMVSPFREKHGTSSTAPAMFRRPDRVTPTRAARPRAAAARSLEAARRSGRARPRLQIWRETERPTPLERTNDANASPR